MRVRGSVKGKIVHILIDTGSTHNFLDLDAAKRLGCPLKVIPAVSVAVANGSKISSSRVSGTFSWKMQGVEFSSDVLILPLGGYDVVLGIQWLVTLVISNGISGSSKWSFWWGNRKYH